MDELRLRPGQATLTEEQIARIAAKAARSVREALRNRAVADGHHLTVTFEETFGVVAEDPTQLEREMAAENAVRCCCPVCGYQFDQVADLNVCPTQHYGRQEFGRDELIGCYDDYEWCQ